MTFKLLVELLVVLSTIESSVVNCIRVPNNSDNYGLYKAEWTNFQLCSGPKRTNATKVSAALVKIENSYICYMNMSYIERTKIEQVTVDVFTRKKTRLRKLWSNKVKDVCSHYALAPLAVKYYHINKDCIVEKGDKYYVTNMTDMTNVFFGNTFFYGEFYMRAVVVANKGNVICLEMNCVYRRI